MAFDTHEGSDADSTELTELAHYQQLTRDATATITRQTRDLEHATATIARLLDTITHERELFAAVLQTPSRKDS